MTKALAIFGVLNVGIGVWVIVAVPLTPWSAGVWDMVAGLLGLAIVLCGCLAVWASRNLRGRESA